MRPATQRGVLAIIAVLVVVVFAIDVCVPTGIALCLLYVPLLLIVCEALPAAPILPWAAACSFLTVADVFLSEQGADASKIAFNRTLTILAIGLVTIVRLHRSAAARPPVIQQVDNPPTDPPEVEAGESSEMEVAEEVDVADTTREYVWASDERGSRKDNRLDRFVDSLHQCELLTDDEAASLSACLPAAGRCSPQEIAEDLARQGKLTPYQAWVLRSGNVQDLVFGNYILMDEIGEGGMGRVFKARHRHMDRIIALKVLTEKSAQASEAIKCFRREVRAVARLKHPRIVTAHDAGEMQGVPFLVMEFVEGWNAAEFVKAHGPLSVAGAIHVCLQTAQGLKYAHERGVIHLDVKPSNLILDASLNVVILDLGLARLSSLLENAAESSSRGSRRGVIGTARFMSPEQIFEPGRVDHRSDIYSLGCSLYYLLTGHGPYRGCKETETLFAHRDQPMGRLQDLREDVPDELGEIFDRMVAKRQEERYQSMGEVTAALEGCDSFQHDVGRAYLSESVGPNADGSERGSVTKSVDQTVVDGHSSVRDGAPASRPQFRPDPASLEESPSGTKRGG